MLSSCQYICFTYLWLPVFAKVYKQWHIDQVTVRFYSFFSQLLPSEVGGYKEFLVMLWSMSPTKDHFEGGQLSSTGLSATKAHLLGGMGQWIIISTSAVSSQSEQSQRTELNQSCSQHYQPRSKLLFILQHHIYRSHCHFCSLPIFPRKYNYRSNFPHVIMCNMNR